MGYISRHTLQSIRPVSPKSNMRIDIYTACRLELSTLPSLDHLSRHCVVPGSILQLLSLRVVKSLHSIEISGYPGDSFNVVTPTLGTHDMSTDVTERDCFMDRLRTVTRDVLLAVRFEIVGTTVGTGFVLVREIPEETV